MNNLIIKSMKKFIYLMIFAVAAISCGKSGLDIESGNVLGEVEVSASAGTFTVSVETVGRWIVKEADNASWISFDVDGGVGNGAFAHNVQLSAGAKVNGIVADHLMAV